MQYSTACTAKYRPVTVPNQGRKLKLARRRSAHNNTQQHPPHPQQQHNAQYAPRRSRYRETRESFPLTRRLWVVERKLGIRALSFLFLFPLLFSCPGPTEDHCESKITKYHSSLLPTPIDPAGRADRAEQSIGRYIGTSVRWLHHAPCNTVPVVFGRQSRPVPIGSLTETPAYF